MSFLRGFRHRSVTARASTARRFGGSARAKARSTRHRARFETWECPDAHPSHGVRTPLRPAAARPQRRPGPHGPARTRSGRPHASPTTALSRTATRGRSLDPSLARRSPVVNSHPDLLWRLAQARHSERLERSHRRRLAREATREASAAPSFAAPFRLRRPRRSLARTLRALAARLDPADRIGVASRATHGRPAGR